MLCLPAIEQVLNEEILIFVSSLFRISELGIPFVFAGHFSSTF